MTGIQEVLAQIDRLRPHDKLCYQKIADQRAVSRSTLSRQHRRVQRARDAYCIEQQKLNPQQETELVNISNTLPRNTLYLPGR